MMFKAAMIVIGLYLVVAFINVAVDEWSKEANEPKWYLIFSIIVEVIMGLGLIQLVMFK